jgi:riboflavin biosynthesis pyrimidine reductase
MQLLRATGAEDADDAAIADWYAFGAGITLRSNMIMSADGAAVGPDGLSKSLAGPADGRLLSLLRALADAVIVAAGTMRTEHYRPIRTRGSMARWRAERGLAEHPRLVVITRDARHHANYRALAQAPVRPLVVCARDSGELSGIADVVRLQGDDGGVDLTRAKALLADLGLRRLHTEGGPSLLAGFLRSGLLDEYCLTIAPRVLGGGESLRPVMGDIPATGFVLAGAATAEDYVFLRYRRSA